VFTNSQGSLLIFLNTAGLLLQAMQQATGFFEEIYYPSSIVLKNTVNHLYNLESQFLLQNITYQASQSTISQQNNVLSN
jgi:hypothetical protein